MTLRLDWCSHAAARYAVEHWHYSERMPKSKLAKIGVWEDGRFVGCVIYGVGAGSSTNGKRFGLAVRFDLAELVRVALDAHMTPTSKIVALSIKMVARANPGLRLLTSFADSAQGHIGTIYQASGWVFLGSKEEDNGAYRVRGQIVHPRTLHDRFGKGGQSILWLRANIDPEAIRIRTPEKHHYVYPLDPAMRQQIEPLRKPYPKRATSIGADATGHQPVERGATPTVALHDIEAQPTDRSALLEGVA